MNCLVIATDERVRQQLQRLVRVFCTEPGMAASPGEAMAAIRNPPQLIIIDMSESGGGSFVTLHLIRNAVGPATAVLATGIRGRDLQSLARELGANQAVDSPECAEASEFLYKSMERRQVRTSRLIDSLP